MKSTLDKLYALAVNEREERVCKDISPAACSRLPANFFLILASMFLSKFGDLLMSPKIGLAWLMGSIGVPETLVSWLVPIRESGSMIPQLLIAAWVRRQPKRHMLWVAGSVLQGFCVLGMAAVVSTFSGPTAGWLILLMLAVFSLSRALCSVSSKDVQGKTIPKTRRGRLSGYATTLSGLATILVSFWILGGGKRSGEIRLYLILLVAAACTWFLAALLFALVREEPGEKEAFGNPLKAALHSAALLKSDPPFRRFVVARALLLASALSAPFVVILAQRSNPGLTQLGVFILVGSLAGFLSAPVWGGMADAASNKVMMLGGALAAAVCLVLGIAGARWDLAPVAWWLLPGAYFVLSVAHAGVRIGRKTYVVDMARGNQRTAYVAVSNTAIGLLLLLAGGISALASLFSVPLVLMVLGISGLLGSWMSARLQPV